MAFGFPAYFTGGQRFGLGQPALAEVVAETLGALGWPYEPLTPNTFAARNRANLWSWGERMSVEVSPDGSVTARSECALPTQCFDWGKNRRNVEVFFAELTRAVSAREARRLPVSPYDEENRTPVERVIEGGESEGWRRPV